MKIIPIVALAGFAGLAGCTAPADYPGEIVAYNGEMLYIEGMMNQPSGMAVAPTPAMQASAEDTCGGPARFVGWDSEPYGGATGSLVDSMTITYRFLCR